MGMILVVDDSSTVRKMIEMTLLRSGHMVVTANDGQAGREMLERSQFDLVILDINMPRVGGFEMLQWLRTTPVGARTPVLMLTTRGGAEDRALADSMGATEYMTKPFRPLQLEKMVASLMGR